jgi:hypothetical protein
MKKVCVNKVSAIVCATQVTLVLTYVFLCVEISDGILCSDRDLDFAENPTVLEDAEFHSTILEVEILELQRLEDMGHLDE